MSILPRDFATNQAFLANGAYTSGSEFASGGGLGKSVGGSRLKSCSWKVRKVIDWLRFVSRCIRNWIDSFDDWSVPLVFELFVCCADELSYLVRKPDMNGLDARVLHHPWREKNGFLGGLQDNPHVIQLRIMVAKILVGPQICAQRDREFAIRGLVFGERGENENVHRFVQKPRIISEKSCWRVWDLEHTIDFSLERVVFLVEVGGEVSVVLENEIGLSRLVLLDGRGHFLCLIRMTIEHADQGSPRVFQGFSQSQKLRKLL